MKCCPPLRLHPSSRRRPRRRRRPALRLRCLHRERNPPPRRDQRSRSAIGRRSPGTWAWKFRLSQNGRRKLHRRVKPRPLDPLLSFRLLQLPRRGQLPRPLLLPYRRRQPSVRVISARKNLPGVASRRRPRRVAANRRMNLRDAANPRPALRRRARRAALKRDAKAVGKRVPKAAAKRATKRRARNHDATNRAPSRGRKSRRNLTFGMC